MKKKSVYILEVIHPRVAQDGRAGHYDYLSDGSVKCRRERIGVYTSVVRAEMAMMQYVESTDWQRAKWKDWSRPFGFALEEVRLDSGDDGNGNFRLFESRRSYLADGTPNCVSDLDDSCEKSFRGREKPVTAVKEGGLAWLCGDDRITPVLVAQLPMTEDEWRTKLKPGVSGDFTDDSGTAYSAEPGHFHPAAVDIFPLSALVRGRISREARRKIRESAGRGF